MLKQNLNFPVEYKKSYPGVTVMSAEGNELGMIDNGFTVIFNTILWRQII